MHKVVFAACLLLAGSIAGPFAVAKDPTQLILHKGARVGIVNMMDAEVTHFHASKVLSESFFKTHLLNWNVDSMLADAVSQRLTQLELVPVPLGATDALMHDRDENFVNNSVAKGLPKDLARQFTQLAAAERLAAPESAAPMAAGLSCQCRCWGRSRYRPWSKQSNMVGIAGCSTGSSLSSRTRFC